MNHLLLQARLVFFNVVCVYSVDYELLLVQQPLIGVEKVSVRFSFIPPSSPLPPFPSKLYKYIEYGFFTPILSGCRSHAKRWVG